MPQDPRPYSPDDPHRSGRWYGPSKGSPPPGPPKATEKDVESVLDKPHEAGPGHDPSRCTHCMMKSAFDDPNNPLEMDQMLQVRAGIKQSAQELSAAISPKGDDPLAPPKDFEGPASQRAWRWRVLRAQKIVNDFKSEDPSESPYKTQEEMEHALKAINRRTTAGMGMVEKSGQRSSPLTTRFRAWRGR